MKILYIKNGTVLRGECEETKIVLPVLCKEYHSFQDSLVIIINPSIKDLKQIQKAGRKERTGLIFNKMEVELIGSPHEPANWELRGQETLGAIASDMLGRQWRSRIDAFCKQYCTVSGLLDTNNYTNLGDTFYFTDVVLGNVKNCSVHLFGNNNKAFINSLDNVILYIHGECDEVQV